jgi:hypothetical protein
VKKLKRGSTGVRVELSQKERKKEDTPQREAAQQLCAAGLSLKRSPQELRNWFAFRDK